MDSQASPRGGAEADFEAQLLYMKGKERKGKERKERKERERKRKKKTNSRIKKKIKRRENRYDLRAICRYTREWVRSDSMGSGQNG
jgi:arginyl-tRNA--protein-N-Asp/Glu arginylyltransferase